MSFEKIIKNAYEESVNDIRMGDTEKEIKDPDTPGARQKMLLAQTPGCRNGHPEGV